MRVHSTHCDPTQLFLRCVAFFCVDSSSLQFPEARLPRVSSRYALELRIIRIQNHTLHAPRGGGSREPDTVAAAPRTPSFSLVMVTMHGVPQQATGHTKYMIVIQHTGGTNRAGTAERDLTLTHECTCYRATRCTLRHTDNGVVRQRVHWWVPASMPLPYDNRTMPSPSIPRTDRRTTPPAARRRQASAAYYLLRRLTWRPMLRPRLRRGLSPDWCRCHNLFGARRPWRKQQVVRLVIRDQWRLALDESFGHDGPCDRERLWADPARRKHDIPAPFRLLARAHAQTRRRVSGGGGIGLRVGPLLGRELVASWGGSTLSRTLKCSGPART